MLERWQKEKVPSGQSDAHMHDGTIPVDPTCPGRADRTESPLPGSPFGHAELGSFGINKARALCVSTSYPG